MAVLTAEQQSSTHDTDLDALRKRLVDNYDGKAYRYDRTRSVESAEFYFGMSYRTIDAMLGPTDEKTVHLDMPVGTGRFLLWLRDHGRAHRMIGIDISSGMLGVCRDKSEQCGYNIELSLGDAFHLPVADNSVDILTGLRLFHLFPIEYWPAIIAEMHRVLRPGGLLITEVRNMIRGVACKVAASAFRQRRQHHLHVFAPPHRIHSLFGDWEDVHMQGVGLDGLTTLYKLASPLGKAMHYLEEHSPIRYLSKTMLISAHKAVD